MVTELEVVILKAILLTHVHLFIIYRQYYAYNGLLGAPYAGRALCFATVTLYFAFIFLPIGAISSETMLQ